MAVGAVLQHNAPLWGLVGEYSGYDIINLDATLEDRDKSELFQSHVYQENHNAWYFWAVLLSSSVYHERTVDDRTIRTPKPFPAQLETFGDRLFRWEMSNDARSLINRTAGGRM